MNGSQMVTVYLIVAWFVLAAILGLAGIVAGTPGELPLGLGLMLATPLLLYGSDRRFFGGRLFRGILDLSLPALALTQTWRVGGIFFLIEQQRGNLPAGFALPAGVGDILIGLAAPAVALSAAGGRGRWHPVFVGWNLLGLLDLITAVTLGVTHSESSLGVFAGTLSTRFVAQYPLSLVPTFLVPLAVILHVTALLKSRDVRGSQPRS